MGIEYFGDLLVDLLHEDGDIVFALFVELLVVGGGWRARGVVGEEGLLLEKCRQHDVNLLLNSIRCNSLQQIILAQGGTLTILSFVGRFDS